MSKILPNQLLTLLPKATPLQEETTDGLILMLAAGAAHLDGFFDFNRYQRVLEAYRDFFGENSCHAKLQAQLHYVLLHPPQPAELASIAERLAQNSESTIGSGLSVVKMLLHIAGPQNQHSPVLNDLIAILTPDITAQKTSFSATIRTVERQFGRLYQSAAKYLPQFGQSPIPLSDSTSLPPQVTDALSKISTVAGMLNNKDIQDELEAVERLMREQPFRVVIVGERKHGKSTLINALLGQELSPVREATPETRVVVEFHKSDTPMAFGVLLSEDQITNRIRLLQAESDNLLLQRQLEQLDTDTGQDMPPGSRVILKSETELNEAIRGGGRFAGRLARVVVDLVSMPLGNDTVLVDTPGLNTPDSFLAQLAIDAGLSADCVLMIMDAHNPGSQSELAMLRKLTQMGRTVTVIGVLTRGDLLTDPASLEAAQQQALQILNEACRASGHVQVAGVTSLNARAASNRNQRGAGSTKKDFSSLLKLIEAAKVAATNERLRTGKLSDMLHSLANSMHNALRQHTEQELSRMPSQELLDMLKDHADQLTEAARLSLAQARELITLAQDDLRLWQQETERALDHFSETLTLKLMDAVTETMKTAGHNFAKREIWENFNTETVRPLVLNAVEKFFEEQQDVFRAHEERLRVCAGKMEKAAAICLTATASTYEKLQEAEGLLAKNDSMSAHILVQSHRYMGKIGLVTGGVIVGRLATSPLGVLAAAALLPKIALLIAATLAWGVYVFGREDKRREVLLKQRRKEVAECVEKITSALREELESARGKVTDNYAEAVRQGFNPALESLLYQTVHLRLFLKTMQMLKENASDAAALGQETCTLLNDALQTEGLLPADNS